jgi:hypothetical protein
MRDRIITDELEKRNITRIKELTLGQQIKHHVLYDKEVPVHFLDAAVDGKNITLYGVANSQSLVEAALSAARETVPNGTIQSEIQVVQEYNIMP